MALAVTIVDVAIALPIAFYMAKLASRRMQRILVIAVLTPLWASYLVKAFAWRSVLSDGGIFEWSASRFGLESPGYGLVAVVMTQAYIWLPYVILPIFAGLERVPDSLLDAAGDLGASAWQTLRTVVFPMLVPAIIAGSIFSFSLTLGDYITVNIVGGANQMLGNLVYTNVGAANNLPLAAAVALIPVLIMIGYLGVGASHRRPGEPLGPPMTLSPNVRRLLAVLTGLVLVVMYAPLLIVVINSFNESQSLTGRRAG